MTRRAKIPFLSVLAALADTYAPRHAAVAVEARYQSVRIIAAYDVAELPQ